MAMNINQNYSQFYRGTSTIDTYGGTGVKKQVVKYEFNTTDEHGNKVMDKMSREETLATMKEIRSQYGEDVIVEFSGDGMAALVESGKNANLDEIVYTSAEKQAAMNDAIVQMENTHRMVIPNIQTNRMSISISNQQIYFLDAMKSVAKLASAGKADEKGNMDYGMTQKNYLGSGSNLVYTDDPLDIMRRMDSDAYAKYQEIKADSSKENSALDALKYMTKWYAGAVKNNPNFLTGILSRELYLKFWN